MVNGMHAAAAGLAAHQAWLDALANDIANVNTVGYRRQRIDMRDLEYTTTAGRQVGTGAALRSLGATQSQGALLTGTGPLSLAITGPGYFSVRLTDGTIALTRNGDFRLDGQGSIVLASGERLEPPITLPAGTSLSAVSVGPDGTVTVGGETVGRITVIDVPAPSGLLAAGAGLYVPTQASGAPVPASSRIESGVLEASNVDLAEAMVSVIQAQRGFELSARALRTQDQLMEIVNGIRR